MSAVTSRHFWEDFFHYQERSEWYFSTDSVLGKLLPASTLSDPSLVVLHAGIGNAPIHETFFQGTCLQFDFSVNGLQQVKNTSQLLNLLVVNAVCLPFRDNIFDLIIEKGLFDSITGKAVLAVDQAYQLLCEYHRTLNHSGKIYIFSLFDSCNADKDMLGLLYHPGLSVECRDLLVTPAEVPSQDFCFVYILTKV